MSQRGRGQVVVARARCAEALLAVAAAVAGCGGVETGVHRYHEGPPTALDAGIRTISGDAGTLAVDAGRSRLLCNEQATVVDFRSGLSCDGLEGCNVTSVRLAWSDAIQAFGIASSADGGTRRVWQWTLGAGGGATTNVLLDDVKYADVVTAWPDALRLKRAPSVGLVFGMTGHEGTYPDGTFSATWFVRDGSPRQRIGGSQEGIQPFQPVLGDFVATPSGTAYIEGNADADGNLIWGYTSGEPLPAGIVPGAGTGPAPSMIPTFNVLGADQDGGHQSFWYWTDTGGVTFFDVAAPPDPGYARFGDYVDDVDLETGNRVWRARLDVHSPVRIRASAVGDVFVAGLLPGDPQNLDVRKLSANGATAWATAPPSPAYPVVGLALDVDDAGSLVVAWNTAASGNVGAQHVIVLERYDGAGTVCSRRLLPGAARDVLARPDGHVVVATDDAIIQVSL